MLGKAGIRTRGKLMGRLAAKPAGSARAAACSGLRPRCPVAGFTVRVSGKGFRPSESSGRVSGGGAANSTRRRVRSPGNGAPAAPRPMKAADSSPRSRKLRDNPELAHRRGRSGASQVSGDRTRVFPDRRLQGGGFQTEDFKTQDAREEEEGYTVGGAGDCWSCAVLK